MDLVPYLDCIKYIKMISNITFEHGEHTCAVNPNVFCRWQGVTGFGTRPCCLLFRNEPLYDRDGWLQRCKQCVAQFGKSTDAPPRE